MKHLDKTLPFAFMIVCVLSAFSKIAWTQTFIVENGRANAEIVIAEQPPRMTLVAAGDLQNYLRKMTSAELPIVNAPTDATPARIYVGESEFTRRLGITAEGLDDGAYRMVSGDSWLVLIGTDTDFQPIEPYTRHRRERDSKPILEAWDKISGSKWGYPEGNAFKMLIHNADRDFRDEPQDEPLHLWGCDERGSYNAVCGFLRELGVRWYWPGELGEVVPQHASIALPKIDLQVEPALVVRCEFPEGSPPKVGTDRHDDQSLWYGDCIEILIETEEVSYYQIAISPTSAVVDMHRAGNEKVFRWDSPAEVKTHIGEGEWTIEARIPVIESTSDPFHQVVGRRSLKSLSWYFNLCRQRDTEHGQELSAFPQPAKRAFMYRRSSRSCTGSKCRGITAVATTTGGRGSETSRPGARVPIERSSHSCCN